MNILKFAEGLKVLPILAPVDAVATTKQTEYIDMSKYHWATFVVQFGVITTGTATLTIEASTAASSNATEAAIPFRYRLSDAVATDNLGAITAATSAGVTVATNADAKLYVIDVDPAALPSNPGADFRYLRAVIAPTTDMAACLVNAIAFLEPRYPGNSIASAT